MPFAKRNESGEIVALFSEACVEANEWVDKNAYEVRAFLCLSKSNLANIEIIEHLTSSDMQLIRVLEDLLEVLIAKDVILFTDLPDAARAKLLERRSVRQKLGKTSDTLLNTDDESIIL